MPSHSPKHNHPDSEQHTASPAAQTAARQEALRQRLGVDSFAELSRFPRYFEIETIRACNSRCSICTINDWQNYGIRMDDELFQKIVTEMVEYRDWIQTVCLSRDGEPLLDKEIADKILLLKNSGIKFVTLTTNAQLLTEQKAIELVESGLDDIMISIDGATKSTFERIRVGLDFDVVVENTKTFIKIRNQFGKKLSVRIRFVINPENKHETEEWLSFWQDKVSVIDRVYAMPMHSWGGQLTSAVIEPSSERPCVFLFSSMAIHADGSVGQCNVDYNATPGFGNITTQTIREIWTSAPIERLRQQHLSGNKDRIHLCRGCSLWDRSFVEVKTDT